METSAEINIPSVNAPSFDQSPSAGPTDKLLVPGALGDGAATGLNTPNATSSASLAANNQTISTKGPTSTHSVEKDGQQAQKLGQLQQQRRIIAEDPQWNLAPVDKLTDMCVRVIVANFEKSPILKGLPQKYRQVVINTISTEIPLKIAAPLIPDPEYWKRRAKTKFKLASLKDHGGSWKRLFFELHLRDEIENFRPTTDWAVMEHKLKALQEELVLGAPFVETLKLRQLKPLHIVPQPDDDDVAMMDTKSDKTKSSSLDHLDLGSILNHLKNLKDFGVYYGLKDCGIDFSWAYFGMTMQDAISLSNGLKTFHIERLTIQASAVNDDKCRLLCHALLNIKTLKYLDLAHNKIGEGGARGLAKLLGSPGSSLQTLKLSNNQINHEGIKYIGKALQVSTTLEHLDLRLNHLHDMGGQSLLVALFKTKSMVSLDLSGNGLENKTVMALAALLKLNIASLARLDFSCNKLGDYTGEPKASSTSNLMGVPKVTDAAGKTLFEAISQNKYIIGFDLRTTGISPEYLVAIQGIVSENSL